MDTGYSQTVAHLEPWGSIRAAGFCVLLLPSLCSLPLLSWVCVMDLASTLQRLTSGCLSTESPSTHGKEQDIKPESLTASPIARHGWIRAFKGKFEMEVAAGKNALLAQEQSAGRKRGWGPLAGPPLSAGPNVETYVASRPRYIHNICMCFSTASKKASKCFTWQKEWETCPVSQKVL